MTIQVAPDDCTGCGVCVDVCPAKSKDVAKHKAINMEPKVGPSASGTQNNLDYFLACRNRSHPGEINTRSRASVVAAAV